MVYGQSARGFLRCFFKAVLVFISPSASNVSGIHHILHNLLRILFRNLNLDMFLCKVPTSISM